MDKHKETDLTHLPCLAALTCIPQKGFKMTSKNGAGVP